jgi:adenylosuccinate synthase
VRERKHEEMRALWGPLAGAAVERERGIFEWEGVIDAWCEQAMHLATRGRVVPDAVLTEELARAETVVFEGAQGVLLDETWGFHPFTTWSRCTAGNALELIAECGPGTEVIRVGVLRSHAVRHGAGPLPTETELVRPLVSEHNTLNAWQGRVRYGWFDAVLARYALDAVGGVDALALTHLDLLRHLPTWRVCTGYARTAGQGDAGPLTRLDTSSPPTLEGQARLAELLARVTPVLAACEPREDAVLDRLEQVLERRIELVSRGPRASDVSLRSPLPGIGGCPRG